MSWWLRRLSLVFLTLFAGTLSAQDSLQTATSIVNDCEWSFVRLAYDQANYRYACRVAGFGNRTDYPDAEFHLRQGIDRLTLVTTGEEQFLRPGDPNLMNFPWLYAVEGGQWDLDESEAAHLREYLLRGGFLMVDDFHGTEQWSVFETSMRRVFPERPIVEIPEGDPVMSLVFEVDRSIQIPANQFIRTGQTYQCDGYDPHYRGIYDDEGRLMVMINFNMDLADAWEHANDPLYPEPMTGQAIRFAVNYVIYSMTH